MLLFDVYMVSRFFTWFDIYIIIDSIISSLYQNYFHYLIFIPEIFPRYGIHIRVFNLLGADIWNYTVFPFVFIQTVPEMGGIEVESRKVLK